MSAPRRDAGARARREVWDRHARWWQETFTDGADPEYEHEILPGIAAELSGCHRILDLGCGEGQVARYLLRSLPAPAAVVGIDRSVAQLANAQLANAQLAGDPAPHYLRGEGERLPFADASFDGVVCALVIEHAEDADAVLDEVARVLAPGGRFVLLVNHPLLQGSGSGLVDDQILGETYWRVGPYLDEGVTWEEVDAGVRIPFAHRPLSRYVNPLAEHDLLLVHMREPAPPAELLATSVAPDLEQSIPRLLAMRFEHRPRAAGPSPWVGAGTRVEATYHRPEACDDRPSRGASDG